MRDKILVIGGYGTIGKYICSELIPKYPDRVIIGGRNFKKAKKLNEEMNNLSIPLAIDIYARDFKKSELNDVSTVISCISPASKTFFQYCLKEDINYIDISPSLENINEMKDLYTQNPSTKPVAVFGVGLAPGLSNIMVKNICKEFDAVKEIEISLILGLGESHGKNGINWLLENLDNEIEYSGNKIRPFSGRKRVLFPTPLRKKTTYVFNNADQYIAKDFLGIENIVSRFGYDISIVTDFVAFLQKIGFFKLMKFRWIKKMTSQIFSSIISFIKKTGIGSDIYSIAIEAKGYKNGNLIGKKSAISGNNNSELTAKAVLDVFYALASDNNVKPKMYFNNISDHYFPK